MNTNKQTTQKGVISTIEGSTDRNGDKTTARVLPCTADGAVTRPLNIPWHLRGAMGNLAPGTEVVYTVFEDGTGSIMERTDGEWSGTILGNITVKNGSVNVPNGDVKAEDVSLKKAGGADAEKIAAMEKDIAALKEELYYEEIVIKTFNHNGKITEMGDVVESVTLTWELNKMPTALTLNDEAVALSQSGAIEFTNISETTTWALKATDERDAMASKTATLSFYNGVYYGAGAEPEGVDVSFLTKVLTNTRKRTFTANAGEDEYIWYALPTRLGECTFKVGGFEGGFVLFSTVDFTNGFGRTEPYYIYKSANAALGETTVEVS